MKLAIFGASVSAQSVNHATKEVTGYSKVLQQDYMAKLGLSEIRQITYAGNRASDGGLIRLQQVIDYAPGICLFEPLIEDQSRGTRISDMEIVYIYRRLIDAGILPVTLMLPMPWQRVPDKSSEYSRYKAVCDRLGLPVIRVDLTEIEGIEDKFDGIHTRNEGAKIYAAQIAQELAAIGDPASHLVRMSLKDELGLDVQVKQLPLPNDGMPDSFTNLKLTIHAEQNVPERIRLIQLQFIGPFSPVLDVVARSETASPFLKEQRSVWDPYCHYQRESFVTLSDLLSEGREMIKLEVKCADTDPDYASCRREVATWPEASERCLKPRGPLMVISDTPINVTLDTIE